MFRISTLDHIAIGVKNGAVSVEWYERVLGLKILREKEWGDFPVFMISDNNTGLAIFQNETGNPAKMPTDRKSGLPHIAFRVSREDFIAAQAHLRSENIEFDFQDHHIAHSIYFRDPDDYCIELTTYELGS